MIPSGAARVAASEYEYFYQEEAGTRPPAAVQSVPERCMSRSSSRSCPQNICPSSVM